MPSFAFSAFLKLLSMNDGPQRTAIKAGLTRHSTADANQLPGSVNDSLGDHSETRASREEEDSGRPKCLTHPQDALEEARIKEHLPMNSRWRRLPHGG